MHKALFIEDTEKYIQCNDLFCGSAEEYRAFWRGIVEKYGGYRVMLCYHCVPPAGDIPPAAFLQEIGAILADDMIEYRLQLTDCPPTHVHNCHRVQKEGFDAFAAVHDRKNPDMYWTSERVRHKLNHWRIFQNGEAYAMASMWGDIPEVFALEADDNDIACDLLSAVAAEATASGKKELLFMIDKGAAIASTAAKRLGFTERGFYKGYSIDL